MELFGGLAQRKSTELLTPGSRFRNSHPPLLCRVRRVGLSHHTFNVEVTGSNPVRDTFFGIGYGDGRLCKSLADKFESCVSHLLCLRNSVGLEYRAFNTGVASSSLAGGTYFYVYSEMVS